MKSEEKIEKLKHENKMKELQKKFELDVKLENLIFDHHLQLQRIKSAEIKKNLLRKF